MGSPQPGHGEPRRGPWMESFSVDIIAISFLVKYVGSHLLRVLKCGG